MAKQNNSNSKPKGPNRSRNNGNHKPKENGQTSTASVTLAKELPSKGRSNDPNWYFTNADLAAEVAQISFQSYVGAGPIFGEKESNSSPSIMAIYLNPAPGLTYNVPTTMQSKWEQGGLEPSSFLGDKYATGINIAGNKTYTILAMLSGRGSNYAPQDISSMELGISSVAELSEHLRRIFGILMLTNMRNRALPRKLVEAMGVDYDDALKNAANYRMRFNTEISRVNQIPLLENVAFIRKSRDIYQHIYTDSASPMGTLFFYRPASVWQLDEDSYEQGTILRTVVLAGGELKTMGYYLDILSEMISALLNSATLNLVYADLLHASEKMNIKFWTFDYLAENYAVMPEFNRNALLQLHNLTIAGPPVASDFEPITDGQGHIQYYITPSNDVYPDVLRNALVYNPAFVSTFRADWHQDYIVDFDVSAPDLVDKIEATRFTTTRTGYRRMVQTVEGDDPIMCSTFMNVPDHYAVMVRFYGSTGAPNGYNSFTASIIKDSEIPTDLVSAFSKIDMAPTLYVADLADNEIETSVGSLNYYAVIKSEWFLRVNRLMNMGLFELRL